MPNEDFIIGINVDQRGAQIYSDELTAAAERIRTISEQISAVSFRGIRVTSNAGAMSSRVRREAERRRKDASRTVDAMQTIGEGLQKAVVKEVGTGLKRPSAASGALAQVTGSSRNSAFRTSDGRVFVGVGNFQYLYDSKKVPYALAIEGGSDRAVGRRITGLWFTGSGNPTGFGRPTRTQSFIVMQAREASKILVEAGRKKFRVSGYVHTPIVAHRDYELAVEKFQPQRKTADAIRRIYGF